MIKNNINKFNDDQLEINKCNLEITRLKLENENLKLKLKESILQNNEVINQKLDEINKNLELLSKQIKTINSTNTTNNFGEQLATLGPYVQQINPENMSLVKVFNSVSEVCKEYKVPRSSVVKAAKENTIYINYRWNLVDRNKDPNNINDLPPLKVLQKIQNLGYIAKLNSDKSEILNVYLDRKTASLKNGYNSVAFLDAYVKNNKKVDGHYYVLYETCHKDLKDRFLLKHNLKEIILYKSGVGQYDSNGNLLKEFRSKNDCQNSICIGNKSLCKALETGVAYNTHFYKYLDEKSFI